MPPHYATGEYWGEVLDHGLGESIEKKTPKFYVRFRVLGKVSPEDPDKYETTDEQYERTVDRWITDKTMEYVLEDLGRLGFTGDSFSELNADAGHFDLRGKQLRFYCQHEPDKTDPTKLWERWGLARESVSKPIVKAEDKTIRMLDSLFGKALKGLKKSGGIAAPPADKPKDRPAPQKSLVEQAEDVEGEEDIPF